MIAIFFYRDTLVSIIRVFSVLEGFVVSARQSGKIKAWGQAVSIWLVLILIVVHKAEWWPWLAEVPGRYHMLTSIIIFIAALITLWSGIDYWNSHKKAVINAMKPKPTA